MAKKAATKKAQRAKLELEPDITQEELDIFLMETEEQLQLLDQDIVKLEKGTEDDGLMQEIFRAAHTLKGSSAMLGHQRMAALTHAMESVLDRLRKGTLSVSTPVVDALLSSLDVLKVLKDEITTREISDVDITAVVAELDRVREEEAAEAPEAEPKAAGGEGGEAGAAEICLDASQAERVQEALSGGRSAFRVKVAVGEDNEWAAIRCFQVLKDLSESGEVVTSLPTQAEVEAQQVGRDLALVYTTEETEEAVRDIIGQIPDLAQIEVEVYGEEEEIAAQVQEVVERATRSEVEAPASREGDREDPAKGSTHEAKTSQTVRIDVQRLDDLMNMVGELAIFHPRIHQIGKILESTYKDDENVRALGETSTNAIKIVNELQEDIIKIRMLPVGTVFNSFPRMVRDLARKAGKDVNFIIEGQETEIDRTVVDHVRDPVIHLLRNAVDHGMERPAERVAAGKAKKGTIRLAAWHEEGHIVIVTEDDGGGIDPERVKASAVKKGVITAEGASQMKEEEAIDLIFHPGMSTAERATEVSGRGVGLDVVRKNIEALNGVVMVDTEAGVGTKFMLRMPLTLATFQGLLVTSAETIYAIPLISVTETLKLEELETRRVEAGEIIRVRDSIMPLVRLRQVFGGDGVEAEGEGFVVVVKDRARDVGLAVDSLMEPQEVVVKGLKTFRGSRGRAYWGMGQWH
jgi:two-component system chemotaxis sensor kinase CheA